MPGRLFLLTLTRACIAATLVLCAAGGRAAAQGSLTLPERAFTRFVAVNLDGGVTRGFDPGRWRALGAAAAGLGIYDGQHVWDFTAGVRGIRHDQRAVIVSAGRIGVESGLGLHLTALWDLDRRAPGAAAAVSFSLLDLQGALTFDGRPTTHVSLFLRVPAGMLAYVALGGQR